MRIVGVITKLRFNNGYGFVRGISDNLPRFFNAKDVRPVGAFDTLHEGQKVEFTPIGVLDPDPTAKHNGLRAEEVVPCVN